MDRLALLLIGLLFGGGIGFVLAAGTGATFDGHDHAAHRNDAVASGGEADAATHDHGTPHSLPPGPNVPTVEVALTPDPVSGWTLHVETRNFAFAPESAGAPHVPGEGHAHVYVDGEKNARLYGPWMHVPALPAGATVEVTLNANDHRPLTVQGEALAATATVPGE